MDTAEMIGLLEQKKELFQTYEVCTRALFDCEIDAMSDYITKRADLAIEIDKIDARIQEICAQEQNGALLSDVAANRCNYADAPQEWVDVFLAGQAVLAVVGRLVEIEERVMEHMQGIQTDLKKKIADTQNTPKIAKYLTGPGNQNVTEAFIMDKA